ncbi:ATP-binding protein [Actinomadura sp. 3N407]|uniref:ATP-binding protein n=1 Tax=Actinomadura sp. 3N407 TaxID=3457423 RepID=UPI003FCDC6DF
MSPPAASLPANPDQNAWPGVCEQFSQQVLLLAEQLRPSLDELEGEEEDPDRLQLLYQVDHAVTRMRRAAREMSVLAGSGIEEMAGHTTSLVDVVRLAESSIERYTQVVIGKVVELAVVAYAADDVASLAVVLMDNATRYSPSTVTVSAHLLDNGAVMMRIEDSGIGIAPDRLQDVNEMLAGPVRPIGPETARHTGFPVAHRLARKHGIGVRLACRPAANGSPRGTVAMIVIPPALLCELVDEPPAPPARSPRRDGARDRSMAHLTVAGPVQAPDSPAGLGPAPAPGSDGPDPLPRRQSMSLRRSEPKAEPTATLRSETAAAGGEASARSFADDLEAFTTGGLEAGPQSGVDAPEGRTE